VAIGIHIGIQSGVEINKAVSAVKAMKKRFMP